MSWEKKGVWASKERKENARHTRKSTRTTALVDQLDEIMATLEENE
jgi:hypothetical protein